MAIIPNALWLGVVVPVKDPSIDQIGLFKNYSCSIGLFAKWLLGIFIMFQCSERNFGRLLIISSLTYNAEYWVWNANAILRILSRNATFVILHTSSDLSLTDLYIYNFLSRDPNSIIHFSSCLYRLENRVRPHEPVLTHYFT